MSFDPVIRPLDRDDLRRQARGARPFPNVCIDHFLEDAFAEEVLAAFPTLDEALRMGRTFSTVNERGKVQVADPRQFAAPIARLNRALSAPEFLDLLSTAFAIPNLVADEELAG